jgi:hypothetical protein
MGYLIDLKNIPIADYLHLLKNQDLIPSRKMLQDDIDANFKAMQDAGIRSVAELKAAISTPQKITMFSAQSQVSIEYLTLLKREIGSLDQKPVLLAHFPGIDPLVIKKLNDGGIESSKNYYDLYCSQGSGKKLAALLEVSLQVVEDLWALSNLVRLNGVGALAARTFLDAGYRSVADVANARAGEMLAKVTQVNETRHYYSAKLGQKDIQFCIDFAKTLRRWEHAA